MVGMDKWHTACYIAARECNRLAGRHWRMGSVWSMASTSLWWARVVDKVHGRSQGGVVPGGELCRLKRSLLGCLLSAGRWRDTATAANR
jgi:hypothetical protein